MAPNKKARARELHANLSKLIDEARRDLAIVQDRIEALIVVKAEIRSGPPLTAQDEARLDYAKSLALKARDKLIGDIEQWSDALVPLIPYLAE